MFWQETMFPLMNAALVAVAKEVVALYTDKARSWQLPVAIVSAGSLQEV